jgi:hypothetical protein
LIERSHDHRQTLLLLDCVRIPQLSQH